jgi:hypothetical protein
MTIRAVCLSIIAIGYLTAQTENDDYPSWFRMPQNANYVIGLAKNTSDNSVTLKNAYLDALAISSFTKEGTLQTSTISYLKHMADSLGMELGSQIRIPSDIQLIESAKIADLYIGLFEIFWDDDEISLDQNSVNTSELTAIGKQTLHPDRIFESWASAEIEAFKELARSTSATVSSIQKKENRKYEKLIYLKSKAQFHQIIVTRRWIKNSVCHVQVSEKK